jgi:transcription elongation factor GreA
MTSESNGQGPASPSLQEAFTEYLASLKPEQRNAEAGFVSALVNSFGGQTRVDWLSGSRVESYAETAIRPNDPAASDRVAALKRWFQFLKKRGYAAENLGIHVRLKRTQAGRSSAAASRTRAEAEPVVMTPEGKRKIEEELEELRRQERGLIQAIATAREDKDFRENAPLDAAREALGHNHGRRRELEDALKRAVVQTTSDGDRAGLGSIVQVTQVNTSAQRTFRLVNAREANAREQLISVDSPVGKQLIGRRPGEEVVVDTPSGPIQFRIDAVTQT